MEGGAIGLCVGLLVGAIILYWKSLVGSYGGKSGEIFAMKHNIDLILDHQKKTTELTEKIKTDLSDKSLARQRHEEMKRDTALELMSLFGTMQEAAFEFHQGAMSLRHLDFAVEPSVETKKDANDKYDEARAKFQAGITKYWQLEQICRIVFPIAIYEKLERVKQGFINFRSGVFIDSRKFDPLMEVVDARQADLSIAIKAELQI